MTTAADLIRLVSVALDSAEAGEISRSTANDMALVGNTVAEIARTHGNRHVSATARMWITALLNVHQRDTQAAILTITRDDWLVLRCAARSFSTWLLNQPNTDVAAAYQYSVGRVALPHSN